MAKIIILGNDPYAWWLKNLPDTPRQTVPNIQSNREADMAAFVSSLPTDIDSLVIDADSLYPENSELPLKIALYVRLMLHTCLKSSLSHIVIVTDLDIDTYRGYGVLSMLLMTRKISMVKSRDIMLCLESASPLSPAEYVEGFLNLIKIEPKEKVEGRHSIANEWGAYILAQSISAGTQSVASRPSRHSEYFLYSSSVALDANDVAAIVERNARWMFDKEITVSEKFNYLLIDDEAEKGWKDTLALMLPNGTGDCWDKKATDLLDIDKGIRKNIEMCEYDLIFLDLRMNGVQEENVINPEEFSGMKILRAIKLINPGLQVIMLTATNKGWNVKAMLDAGADGYYMKEAPEYHFPPSYTEQNTLALKREIEKCLSRKYLKDKYQRIKNFCPEYIDKIAPEIISQLEISFELVRKATSEADFAFAYISLEQVFEIVVHELYDENNKESKEVKACFVPNEKGELIKYNLPYLRRKLNLPYYSSTNQFPMWVKVCVIYHAYHGAYSQFYTNVKKDIELRNIYLHKDKDKEDAFIPFTSDDYENLFDSVMEFLSVL